jgi:hypothetical protein
MSENIRYFYRAETSPSGVERRFSIAYLHDRATGDTRYGASVFRRDSRSEAWIKRAHRATALGRLTKSPVKINVVAESANEVENAIRDAIKTHGVRCDGLRAEQE